MSGEALYTRVAQIDPPHARRFIFMTGVGFGADVEQRRVREAAAKRPTAENVALAAAAVGVTVEQELAGLASAPDSAVIEELVKQADALEPQSPRPGGSVRSPFAPEEAGR